MIKLNFSNKMLMKILFGFIIFFILTIYVLNIFSTEFIDKHVSLEKFTTHLDERISVLIEDYNIPGLNIAIVQKGETVWSKAYGYADLEQGRRMTLDTHCRVESISKSVTAWGVMKLVDEGKIDLDKPIIQYIKNWEFPESEFSKQKITSRLLLSHSAGMPLGPIGIIYSTEEDKPSLREYLSQEATIEQPPGQEFYYSNIGFDLLELLIEEVTGRDFAEYMENEVLTPLGMINSSFIWDKQWDPPVPNGYDIKGNPIPVYLYPDKAAGGLFSTVEDIATFIAAGMTNFNSTEEKVLNIQSISQLYKPMVEISGYYKLVFDSYGLGHFIEDLSNGNKAISHGGQGTGWMTHFHSVPQTGDGIVILTNSQRSWPVFAYILGDWAQWIGLSSVGMEKIILGRKILCFLIIFLLLILSWQAYQLVKSIISGNRRFAPFLKESRFLRLVQFGLFIILLSGFWWAIQQDYLFVSSVFPIVSTWLGFLLLLSVVILLFLILFPLTKDTLPN